MFCFSFFLTTKSLQQLIDSPKPKLPPNSGPLVRIGAARRLVAGGSDLLWVGPLAKQSDYSNILNVSFISQKKKKSKFSTKEHRGISVFFDSFEVLWNRNQKYQIYFNVELKKVLNIFLKFMIYATKLMFYEKNLFLTNFDQQLGTFS